MDAAATSRDGCLPPLRRCADGVEATPPLACVLGRHQYITAPPPEIRYRNSFFFRMRLGPTTQHCLMCVFLSQRRRWPPVSPSPAAGLFLSRVCPAAGFSSCAPSSLGSAGAAATAREHTPARAAAQVEGAQRPAHGCGNHETAGRGVQRPRACAQRAQRARRGV